MKLILLPAVTLAIAAFSFQPSLKAQSLVDIETVTVGDAGNAAGFAGRGSVSYEFAIGKYEVTIGQYTTFLNSVASVTSDGYLLALWNPNMQTDLAVAGIARSGSGLLSDPYLYSELGSANRPITYVGWFDAARFANWMHNGATNGASTETGAYTLNGATSGAPARNADAKWWLPSAAEWYKSAYYKGGGTNAGYWAYPTQSDTQPANSVPSNGTNLANFNNVVGGTTDVGAYANSVGTYGTFDQAGNAGEWTEQLQFFGPTVTRGMSGGSWSSPDIQTIGQQITANVGFEQSGYGFRVATVPEPSTYALLMMAGIGAFWMARRRQLNKWSQQ